MTNEQFALQEAVKLYINHEASTKQLIDVKEVLKLASAINEHLYKMDENYAAFNFHNSLGVKKPIIGHKHVK